MQAQIELKFLYKLDILDLKCGITAAVTILRTTDFTDPQKTTSKNIHLHFSRLKTRRKFILGDSIFRPEYNTSTSRVACAKEE